MRHLLLLSLLCIGSVSPKIYTFRPDAKDARPLDGSFFPSIAKETTWTITFDTSCYYNWLPDQDQYDWNKGGGFTKAFTGNTDHSIMWAWRPSLTVNRFETICYINYRGKHYTFKETLVEVPADSSFSITIKPMDGLFLYNGMDTGLSVPTYVRRTGLWFGGANNAPGPHGGYPGKWMRITVMKD